MILAKSILRENGQVLVGEGAELTDALVDRLLRMRVETITVQGHPVNLGSLGGSSSYARRIGRLDHLFRKHQADPWMCKVKEHLEEFFRMKAAAEEAAVQAAASQKAGAAAASLEAGEPGVPGEPGEPGGPAVLVTPGARKGGFLSRLFKRGDRG
ncbi:hypothetical protein [Megalodesulfovibrio gigas]|nr:hypothetical protein [Megalodesulfovibrio gigas]